METDKVGGGALTFRRQQPWIWMGIILAGLGCWFLLAKRVLSINPRLLFR